MSSSGAEPAPHRPRFASFWREHRARWTLPLVIIVIIAAVAIIDHVGSRRISQAVEPHPPPLVAAADGTTTVYLDQPWAGFNPGTPAGAVSSTPSLLSSVLPSAYVVNPKLLPQVNGDLLESVEVTSTSPLTVQYAINPKAEWSDGVPVTADDFVYAWQSQRGDGVDIDGKPDQVASTIGYRDVASVTGSNDGKTATVVFSQPFTDWRILFNDLLPSHVASRVGWNSGFSRFDPAVDLSAGPMMLASATGTTAELVRNPKWWGTPAQLTKVTVSVEPNSSWLGDMSAGSEMVAQVGNFNLSTLSAVTAMPNATSTVRPSLSFLELDFDTKSPVAGHLELRQAIAHAVDRSALLADIFLPLDPGLQVSDDHLATPSQSTYAASPMASGYTTPDVQATDQLLKGLGYHQDPSGAYVDVSGRPLVLRLAVESGDPWIESVANELVTQLHPLGITVQVASVDGVAGLAAAGAAGSYDMALVTRHSSPYQTVTAGWYSDSPALTGSGASAGSAGQQDWTRFSDPQVDQLFVQASQALNPVTGGAFYAQVDNQLWNQMVSLPLFEEPVLEANGVQISNVQFDPSPNGLLWNVASWSALKPGPTNPKT